MGKILISQQILGTEFPRVAFLHADNLASEMELDKGPIAKDLNLAIDLTELKEVFKKYFNDQIKLVL